MSVATIQPVANPGSEIQENLLLAVSAGGIGVWNLDLISDRSWRSPEHDLIFGYEVPVRRWGTDVFFDHVFSEDLLNVKQVFEQSHKTGHLQFECRITRADTTLRWICVRGRVFVNSFGVPIRMLGIIDDITERKRSEETAGTAEEGFRLLVDGVKDYVIYTLDTTGCVATWNKGAERLKGYSDTEVIGKHIASFYSEEDVRAGTPQSELKLAEREGESSAEGWRIRKDGSRFWARVVITALKETDGTLLGFWKFTRDMTADRKAEQDLKHSNDLLKESNHELEAFSYSAAHDLRAPLRHMHGFASVLHQGWYDKLDDEGRYCLDKISANSKQMGGLLDALLNFSRLGRVHIGKSRISLSRTVEQITQEVESELKGRDLTWEVGELPEIDGDPTLIHQVLYNLISNAVKYTRNTENARIEIGRLDGKDGNITIFIHDNGAGFQMEYADKLFHVFQRLHKSEEYEGTGIGLAIVRRIVERHGGRVWAEGAPGKGATFYFSLPTEVQHHG